jgi:hypothetical protein
MKANRPLSFRDYSQVKVFDADVYPIVYSVQAAVGAETDALSLSVTTESKSKQPITVLSKVSLPLSGRYFRDRDYLPKILPPIIIE